MCGRCSPNVPFAKLEAQSLRPLCCLLSALTLFGCLLEISRRKPLRPGDHLRLGFSLTRPLLMPIDAAPPTPTLPVSATEDQLPQAALWRKRASSGEWVEAP